MNNIISLLFVRVSMLELDVRKQLCAHRGSVARQREKPTYIGNVFSSMIALNRRRALRIAAVAETKSSQPQ